MRPSEVLLTSWRSLLANPKRSFLTMLGIVIGIASVITIISLGNGVEKATLKNLQTTKSGQQSTVIVYSPNDLTAMESGFDDSDLSLLTAKENLGLSSVKIINDDTGGVQTSATLNGSSQNVLVNLLKKSTNDTTIIAGHILPIKTLF